jgi:hypothetical protein
VKDFVVNGFMAFKFITVKIDIKKTAEVILLNQLSGNFQKRVLPFISPHVYLTL